MSDKLNSTLNLLVEKVDDIDNVITLMNRMALTAFVMLVMFIVLTLYINKVLNVLIKKIDEYSEEKTQTFSADYADDLYTRNKIDDLLHYCHEMEDIFPNEVYVFWFLGLGYYKSENYQKAEIYFNKVEEINPNWKSSTSGYLEVIDSKVSLSLKGITLQ
ncbi:TPA: tetratricopeptide repeat protein [Vibrio vulnificus]|uniref:tetratricopeptide repeat protein n=1 Tax=Vibrio vulnificus TaxID=672 RepID=UPI0005F1E2D6|nr:tetratricopeptide repeat protein [Vibrio vulnificus]EIH0733655.1 tetratricopeptide repeat protein [Vibrio vulnificus]EIH1439299.1 tetratricopeptide repeat protein [Vibrio vulnificus]HDY7535668.1 tetratricopeptide repeat protein [Vibrio vulnificus]